MHPDLTLIDEGEDELKVDLARRIKAENAIIPNDGARRVTVIRHAHNMNAYAQNALLKELEEPAALRVLHPDLGKAGRAFADRAQPLHTLRARAVRGGAGRLRRRGDPAACALSDRRRRKTRGQHDARGARHGKTPRRALIGVMGVMQVRAARRDLPRGGSARAAAPACARQAVEALASALTPERLLAFYDFTDELVHRISRNAASAAVTCALTSDVYRICYQ
ncbi:MAG: hypothetical protein ACLR4Z_12745 [Butyricicoccaceae bacterium]